eukprot:5851969-Lingulodinium_polyedra.AAC.1
MRRPPCGGRRVERARCEMCDVAATDAFTNALLSSSRARVAQKCVQMCIWLLRCRASRNSAPHAWTTMRWSTRGARALRN